jgi:hydrogenase-4 component B
MSFTPVAIALLCGYALLGMLAGRRRDRLVTLGALCQGAAMGLAGFDAVQVLVSGDPIVVELPVASEVFTGRFVLDPLAAVFVLALVIVGLAIAVYAPAYLRRAEHRMSAATQQILLAVLEASLLAVLIADDVIGFFVPWEIMTATATALVLADGQRFEVKRAAILYVVVTHIGTLAALCGILLLAGDGGLGFSEIRAADHGGFAHGLGVVLVLAGCGAKAGVVPLHVWLPEAHPVAPSHISALLSGVILKVGVYAMLRAALDLGGPPPEWVGYLLLGAGLVSAILGVLYALLQHDLKRLLAFHSVENIGIILLGVGLGVVARHAGMPTLAALAMSAGLFHVINHAVFKALLFLCAGSVHLGTHTHDLEEMGGLARAMPSTARAFLIGALAISALPPLNGFASEWLILESFIGSKDASSELLRAVAPLLAAGLALTGALAAACFVKAYAVAFLALPRSEHARQASEAPAACRAAQNGLAVACIALGLGSPWIVVVISNAAAGLGGWPRLPGSTELGGAGVGVVQPLWLAGVGLVLALVLLALLRRRQVRRTQTWACGLGTVEGRAAYTASAFANPIRRIFSGVYQFERATEPVEGEPPYFVTRSRTRGAMAPVFERYLYQPAVRALKGTADRVTPWVPPTVNRGLMLFAITVAILLIWAVS